MEQELEVNSSEPEPSGKINIWEASSSLIGIDQISRLKSTPLLDLGEFTLFSKLFTQNTDNNSLKLNYKKNIYRRTIWN